ncbi:type II toxin-antitoxin system RelE family toxin [Neorhizobium sp. NPDC001467]|uniref:type II toxin-antitoxin system RelE family toxin n=1 Tax=Neorhizobium sp. NPDC001467 TaxID=3390595 RepID=UPI003CFEDD9F
MADPAEPEPMMTKSACIIQSMVGSIIASGYIDGMKPVQYSHVAQKSVNRMQPKRRAAIRAKIDAFARGERVDPKELSGSPLVRIRVGVDRVVIDEQTNLVLVVDVGPRGGIYKE